MVAKIDLPEGRRRCVRIGCGIVAIGLALLAFDVRIEGIAVVVLGSAFAVWAVRHKTRGLPMEPRADAERDSF